MKLLSFALVAAATTSLVAGQSDELPITTSDVFIQSGEISASSAIIMARCNTEVDSRVVLTLGSEMVQEENVSSDTDFTVSFQVEGLDSNTEYTYSVECEASNSTTAEVRQTPAVSIPGSFKTAPAADEAAAVSFVWVADLAGQGWGRNPDFQVTTTDDKVITGGYVVFETLESLSPDFALFQGDLIYADNAIPPVKEILVNGNWTGNWTNNPSKDYIAVTLDEFRVSSFVSC